MTLFNSQFCSLMNKVQSKSLDKLNLLQNVQISTRLVKSLPLALYNKHTSIPITFESDLFNKFQIRPLCVVPMSTYLTQNRHGYSVRFSPFDPDRLVVATSQYYGTVGGGTLFFLEQTSDGALRETKRLEWTDGLFDVAWSEENPNLVASVSGDGSLQLWNLAIDTEAHVDSKSSVPAVHFKEHTKEVYSVEWSKSRQNPLLMTASWDCSIKLWDPNSAKSMATYVGHSELVYSAKFAHHISKVFASVSADGYLKLWSALDNRPCASINAHDGEILACDWSKHDANVIATGGSDGVIKGWDLRNDRESIFEFYGCTYAVRRIQFSPIDATKLASVSYDSTTRIWDINQGPEAQEIISNHSEFNYGLDWNHLRPNQIADCGWDSLVHVFVPKTLA